LAHEPPSADAAVAAAAAVAARRALERLLDDLPDLAARLPEGYSAGVEAYVRLLLEANARVNLTRLVAPADVARLHILDAIAALPLVDAISPAAAVDLGSGGGVPAIPLAMARPRIEWVMVDSVRKKAAILEAFVAALGLRNVRVVAERAEVLGRDAGHRERYQLVTARACAALPVLVELALPLVRLGGELLAWKGPLQPDDDELRRGRVAAGRLGAGGVTVQPAGPPALGEHTFVVVRKASATPAAYPRRPGEPGRRPLG
jgi:16S rRNA (guanine527-N7)-methyltransferase